MKRTNQIGLSLVEVIIAIGIFALVAGVGYQAYEISHAAVAREDERAQASQYAAEGIEATRFLRDQDFANLTVGSHGISSSTSGWQFSGSSDMVGDFSRTVTVSLVDADTANVSSTVTWGGSVSYQIARSAQFTNWRKEVAVNTTMADAFTINTSGMFLSSGNSWVNGITIETDGTIDPIEIISFEVSWSGLPANRRLQSIYLPLSTQIWSGSSSGQVLVTFSPLLLLNGATSQELQIRFNRSVSGGTLNLIFTMSDGSSASSLGIGL